MEHIFGRAPKGPAPPARGAVAGVKADMDRAKEGFDARNPNGVGMAWTHNFLNQKPWHPMSFKNRMRAWEAEQAKSDADRSKEKAQAEFDAEQEYLKTLSYLSAEEQQRYREVQSVSFMYTKPPGLDAALARDAEAEKKKPSQPKLEGPATAAATAGGSGGAAAGGGGSGGGPGPQQGGGGGGGGGPSSGGSGAGGGGKGSDPPEQQRAAIVERLREDPFTAMLAAREALANNPRLAITRQREAGAFGGFSADATNQQLLGEEPGAGAGQGGGVDAELGFLLQLPPEQQLRALKGIAKRRKKEEQERKLREAEQVLRAAGYDLSAVGAAAAGSGGGGGSSRKHKHEKKRKDKKRSKSKSKSKGEGEGQGEDKARRAKKRRRRHSSDSGSSSSDSDSSRRGSDSR
ncbi:hypothetical protein PLESTB_001219500 [Pleodorina starrii]|uniref:CBF1-interacting co-repressor CIR N-terminal domain-containing protein n=1 Tax=Pleodorina starrii TaxID=330485 RepID=A0A9W6F6C8_9CHLO|nr:hypothetical protein PLESTM_002059600 [Pleodorina starrii]GLC57391.1 hypothetical protein PLESTB_001219500 [Pleodorina starrii]GLC71215.1 hypothetical protein PLESTF_001091000 [Pleodorina starrii]